MHRWLLNSRNEPRASLIFAYQFIARFLRKIDPVRFGLRWLKWNQSLDAEVGKLFDGICIEFAFWRHADFEFT